MASASHPGEGREHRVASLPASDCMQSAGWIELHGGTRSRSSKPRTRTPSPPIPTPSRRARQIPAIPLVTNRQPSTMPNQSPSAATSPEVKYVTPSRVHTVKVATRSGLWRRGLTTMRFTAEHPTATRPGQRCSPVAAASNRRTNWTRQDPAYESSTDSVGVVRCRAEVHVRSEPARYPVQPLAQRLISPEVDNPVSLVDRLLPRHRRALAGRRLPAPVPDAGIRSLAEAEHPHRLPHRPRRSVATGPRTRSVARLLRQGRGSAAQAAATGH